MNELGGYAFADLRGRDVRHVRQDHHRSRHRPVRRALSGDNNAIHINEEFRQAPFQGPHCPWNAVGKRNLRGDRLPGPGSIYVSQSLAFRAQADF
jgi:3-hydroxybutyryl-CoA dehydratase